MYNSKLDRTASYCILFEASSHERQNFPGNSKIN